MNIINTISNDPNQTMFLKTDDGSLITFSLIYSDEQQGWFYSLAYGDFSLNNRRVVISPNLIRSYRNLLSFGLACTTTDGYEPIFLDDFSSGRASFYILNSTDIAEVETLITNA